ncbi:MAG: ribokinase, partial [Clostridia bacterium]
KGANQCVSAQRLGAKTSMIGMLGKDNNGLQFRDIFISEGIDISNVFETEEAFTGCAMVQIDGKSQNRICVIPGANHCFGIEELQRVEDTISSSKIVLAQLELLPEVTFQLIEMCHRHNVPIILNPAPAIPIASDILSKVFCLTPNETELSILAESATDTIEEVAFACKKLYNIGVKCIVATLGSRGAFIYDKDGARIVEAYKVKVVDTVAAGDSFNGALAVRLLEGASVDEAVKFANAMGALTVQTKGAIPSLRNRHDVEKFIYDEKELTVDKVL